MLTKKEERLILKYCQCPKIAIVSVIMALALGGPFLILEIIDDLVFDDKGPLQTGFYIYLGLVIIFMVLFCYCMLAPKFGMRSKKWKELERRAYLKHQEEDYSDRVFKNGTERSMGNLMSKSDTKSVQNLSHVAQFSATVDSVEIATDQAFDMIASAEQMANVYDLKVPGFKKQLLALVLLPIFILVGSYIPQYINANNLKQQNIAYATESINKFKEALKNCKYVSAADPSQRYGDSYRIIGHLNDLGEDKDSYIYVSFNETGVVTDISYYYDIDMNLSAEENLKKAQDNFNTLNSYIKNVDVSTLSNDLLKRCQLSDEFNTQFLNGTYYDEIALSEDGDHSRIYIDFETDDIEEFDDYSQSYIYIYIKSTK